MDHGTQYTADDFLKQIAFWGIGRSFAFVAEPQTNDVIERFNRTLKEQAIHGRLFRNLEEVKRAVTEFQGSLQSALAAGETGLHVTPRSPAPLCHPEGRMSGESVSKN